MLIVELFFFFQITLILYYIKFSKCKLKLQNIKNTLNINMKIYELLVHKINYKNQKLGNYFTF